MTALVSSPIRHRVTCRRRRRRGSGRPRRPVRSTSALRLPVVVSGERAARRPADCQVVIRCADHRDGRGSVGMFAHEHVGDHEIGRRPGRNGTQPSATGLSPSIVGVVFDRCEECGGLVDGDGRRPASAGQTDGVADEQVAVPAGHVVEVEGALGEGRERPGDRLQRGGSHRVASPPGRDHELGQPTGQLGVASRRGSRRRPVTPASPRASAGRRRSWAGSGRPRRRRAGHRCGARPFRSRCCCPSARPSCSGRSTSSSAMRPPGRTTLAISVKNVGRSSRLRSANPQVTPSTDPSGTGRRRMSACTRGAPERSALSMPKLRSMEIGSDAAGGEIETEVAGTAREVEHGAPGRQREITDRTLPPSHVEPERDDAIQPVVLRRDGVEHPLDRRDLLLALGELRSQRVRGGHPGRSRCAGVGHPVQATGWAATCLAQR